jgi:hypothetical protein
LICARISSVALAVLRQPLHLGRDDGESLAGIAGARRLDGGVQRQQVGLTGDAGDQPHNVADLLRPFGEGMHDRIGPLCRHDGLAGDLCRLIHLTGNLAN